MRMGCLLLGSIICYIVYSDVSTMRKTTISIIIMLLLALPAFSQSYTYDEVIKKAGIALTQVLPSHLIPAVEINYSPYYLSLTPDEEWKLLEKGKKTKGKLQKLNVRYKFLLRYTTCSNFSNVEANIELELNDKLELVSHKGINNIPEYILKNLPCPLITPTEAVAIAAKNGVKMLEQNIKPYYNSSTKKFTYAEHGVITPRGELNPDSVKVVRIATFKMDAETGEVLENTIRQ